MRQRSGSLAGLMALILVACVLVVVSLQAPEPEWAARYPEFREIDERVLETVRARLPEWALRPDIPRHPSESKQLRELRDTLEGLASRGDVPMPALLAVLLERNSSRSWTQVYAIHHEDANRCPLGMWLADHADPTLDPFLLRFCGDRKIRFELRLNSIIGLCRAGNAAVVPGLAAIALDTTADTTIRKQVLFRLPRIGAPLSPHLEELLYQPFHDLDQQAAAAIARVEPCPAPSLLLEGLRPGRGDSESETCSLVQAVLAMTDGESLFTQEAGASKDLLRQTTWEGPASFTHADINANANRVRDRLVAAHETLATALESWLTRHPEILDTEFERARRVYRESEQFRREQACDTVEEIIAADEADLDLAACALVIETWEPWRTRSLDALNRLASLVRRDLDGSNDPERIIEALNRRLLRGPRVAPSTWEDDISTRLIIALGHHHGNCMAMSLLYLAVANRLELPIHPVFAPEHVFLRWDDGTFRRNIEPTEGGAEHPDEDYRTRSDRLHIRDEEIESGLLLAPVGRKRMLAALLGNLANCMLQSPRIPAESGGKRALEWSSQALEMDPRCETALLARAQARLTLEPAASDLALADLEAALALRPESFSGLSIAGAIYTNLGRADEAISYLDRALATAPGDLELRELRARCHYLLRRHEETVEICDGILEDRPDHRAMRQLRLLARVHLRRDGWMSDLDGMVAKPEVHPELHLAIARILLREDTEKALAVLDRLKGLETPDASNLHDDGEGGVVLTSSEALASIRLAYFELRRDAYILLGRTEEANAARKQAEALTE